MSKQRYNVLFAVRPDAAASLAVIKACDLLCARHGLSGSRRRRELLHATLLIVGESLVDPSNLIQAAIRAGDMVRPLPFFEVAFERALTLRGRETLLALVSGDESGALKALHDALGLAMGSQGVASPKRRSFTPHISLLYGADPIDETYLPELVAWTVRDFVLIKSHVGKGVHELVGQWALPG